MSFEDSVHRIESGFVEPLRDFRHKTATLNTLHHDSMKKLQHSIAALLTGSDGYPPFQGDGADALASMVSDFIQNEHKLSGTSSDARGWDLSGRLGDAATINEKYATFFENMLSTIKKAQPATTQIDQAATGVSLTAGALDGGAIVQGGLDIPWDIIAAAASGLALGMMIGDALTHAVLTPDLQRTMAAAVVMDEAVPKLKHEYQTIEHNNPLPPELESPKGPQGDYKAFLLLLGISVGAAGALLLATMPVDPKKKISKLTPEELAKLKQYLSDTLGCSPTQIQNIIDQVEKLDPTAEQLQQLLQALKIRAQLQALLDQVENSTIPTTKNFQKMIKGDFDRINSDILSGAWIDWQPTFLRSWLANMQNWNYQWQAAQYLHARDIETPRISINGDVISSDNAWYEVKNVQGINRGDSTYENLLEQLKIYADQVPDDARGIGIVIPPGDPHKGNTDWNIGNQLLRDLKNDYPDDPRITRLTRIDVKFLPPALPNLLGNRWCRI